MSRREVVEDGDFRVIFIASDYPATVSFYRDTLELPVVTSWDNPAPAGTLFAAGAGTLEVIAPTAGRTSPSPTGFRLLLRRTDPDGWCRRLRDKGVDITVPLVDRPWGYREFAVTDPDGIQIFLPCGDGPVQSGSFLITRSDGRRRLRR